VLTPSPPSAGPPRSPRPSGTSSPAPAPGSASAGSSPSPASPASSTRQLGIRHAILASQVRQLEDAAGTTLLRTSPDGTITLTIDGRQFARDVAPVLNMLDAAEH
jgi:hypothetical protein